MAGPSRFFSPKGLSLVHELVVNVGPLGGTGDPSSSLGLHITGVGAGHSGIALRGVWENGVLGYRGPILATFSQLTSLHFICQLISSVPPVRYEPRLGPPEVAPLTRVLLRIVCEGVPNPSENVSPTPW